MTGEAMLYPLAILNIPVPPMTGRSIVIPFPNTNHPYIARVLPLYAPSVKTKLSIVESEPSFPDATTRP